jgi:hypothetical protein
LRLSVSVIAGQVHAGRSQLVPVHLHATGFVENEDPIEFEVGTFRRSLGLLYPGLLRWAGVRGLHSRQEIDQVAEKLKGLGL